MHAGLFGTFCNFKRERQNDLFPFEKQNVPNKPACTFIWHIIVLIYLKICPFTGVVANCTQSLAFPIHPKNFRDYAHE